MGVHSTLPLWVQYTLTDSGVCVGVVQPCTYWPHLPTQFSCCVQLYPVSITKVSAAWPCVISPPPPPPPSTPPNHQQSMMLWIPTTRCPKPSTPTPRLIIWSCTGRRHCKTNVCLMLCSWSFMCVSMCFQLMRSPWTQPRGLPRRLFSR